MKVNYQDMLAKNDLNKGQERMLHFFWLHHPKKWTVGEVFQKFRAKYPNISINTIAPRISELKTMGLLEVCGEKVYQSENLLTKKIITKKQDYLRLVDPDFQPGLWD